MRLKRSERAQKLGRWLLIGLIAATGLTPPPQSYAGQVKDMTTNENDTGKGQNDITALAEKANKLYSQGHFSAAAIIWRRLVAAIESIRGASHPDLATGLNNLALILSEQGQYDEAESLYRRSLAITEKMRGPDDPEIAIGLNNLAMLLSELGQYTKAESLFRRSLATKEKAFGPDHPEIALSLNNLALLLSAKGQYTEAEPLFRRALAIQARALGDYHPDIANTLNNLAGLLQSKGQYGAAEPLYHQALTILENKLGSDHPRVATGLNNLATLLNKQRQYARAEALYRRSLAIREKSLGPVHPDVANSLDNLARLKHDQGRYAEAEILFRRSLDIRSRILGPDHPDTATTLNNLAGLFDQQKQYSTAEYLYRRALGILEKALGPDHLIVATTLNNLAGLMCEQGRYASAEPLYRRSLAIREKTLGPDHPDVATSLNNLAVLLDEQKKYVESELLYRHSLAIREKSLGLDHPDIAQSLNNLAAFYIDTHQYARGTPALRRALAIESNWLSHELPLFPDQTRAAQLRHLGRAWEAAYTYITRHPSFVQLALETRLNRQGLLPEIEQRQTLLLKSPGIDQNKLELLRALTQQLASVSLPTEGRAAVREQRDRLQSELYRQVPDLRIQTVRSSDVAKALPTDGVLVEFQRFHPFDGRKPKDQRWGKPQYIALILKPNGSISAVPLGAAAAIDATVHKGLSSSAEGLSDAEALWAQLSDQVLRPLLAHLSGSRQWFLSADGELNRVPFAALPSPHQPGTPLAAAVQLRLLTTGRELVRLQQQTPASGASVVMANPSYDRHGGKGVATTQPDATATVAQHRSTDLGSNRWLPLPGTEREGQEVASLLGTRLINGPAASTTTLQQQQGPRVLHVATHGFFVADQESSPSDPLRTIQEQAPQLRAFRGEEPLLRSGLVLAGANQPDLDPNDDGYLTAAEALSLKLQGTELVVLSACSTAQGDIRTGEGVYGLQRALTVAGARSTLLSLWKVDDAATAEFMTRFYRRLKAGEGRADALAAVQQEFRDGKTGNNTWREPAYWAAWQLVGDWRPIQGL